jgi:transposase-like protein
MPRQRRVFSPEFKLRVVQEVESGQSQASVARKYELSPHLIPLWKKALQAGRLGGEATGDPSVEVLLRDQQIKGRLSKSRRRRSTFKKSVGGLATEDRKQLVADERQALPV